MTSSQKIVWSVVGIIALLLIGAGFYYSNKANTLPVASQEEIDQDVVTPITLDVKHQYVDGQHIVAGVVDLPTPCHQLQTSATVNSVENIATIEFVTSTNAATDVCAQVITSVPFKVQFEGDDEARIVGTFNGDSVNLNIFEVPSDENIDTFEIYTKG